MKLRKEDFHFFKPLETVGIAIYEGIINICLYNNYNHTIKVCNWMINGHSVIHDTPIDTFEEIDYVFCNTNFNIDNIYPNATISFQIQYGDNIYTLKRESREWSCEVQRMHYVENFIPDDGKDENDVFFDADGNKYLSYDEYFDSLVEVSPDIKVIHKTRIAGVSYRVEDGNNFYIYYECKSMVKDSRDDFRLYCALYNKRGKIKAQEVEFVNYSNGTKRVVQHFFYNQVLFNEISKIYIYIK